jgi:hypothetical protein
MLIAVFDKDVVCNSRWVKLKENCCIPPVFSIDDDLLLAEKKTYELWLWRSTIRIFPAEKQKQWLSMVAKNGGKHFHRRRIYRIGVCILTLGCEISNNNMNMDLGENVAKYNKLNGRIKRNFGKALERKWNNVFKIFCRNPILHIDANYGYYEHKIRKAWKLYRWVWWAFYMVWRGEGDDNRSG